MRVYVKGQGAVSLTQKDFVASGGEGQVFAKGSTAFKIYTDPRKMIPLGKISDLANLTHPAIINPQKVVTDKAGLPIGYTMAYQPTAYSLCQLLPRAFRERQGLTPEQMAKLVQKLRDGVAHIHHRHVLIVDLNEMNFLVDRAFRNVYFIDVDSYQTLQYPATALMDSVRDRHMAPGDFTYLTDWFSFGIVSFQMFTGIHPFKGKHPKLKGFDARMKANISVFHPDVKVPRVVYPWDVIPESYRQWYTAVFDHGKRVPPPEDLQGSIIVTPTVRKISGTMNLDIKELMEFPDDIRGFWESYGSIVVATSGGVYLDQRLILDDAKPGCEITYTNRLNKPVLVQLDGEHPVQMTDLTNGQALDFGLSADQMMSTNGRVYLKNRDKILEVVFNEMGGEIITGVKLAGNVLPQATRLFEGGALQDLLGSTYVSLFPRPGATYQIHLEELDEYRVIEARYQPCTGRASGGGVLMVLGSKKGQYDRLIFRFDENMDHDLRVVEDVTPAGLNFTVLDSGVCVSLTESDQIELFSVRRGSSQTKVIDDQMLGGDMTLGCRGGQVAFSRGPRLFSMRMK